LFDRDPRSIHERLWTSHNEMLVTVNGACT
jgi:hypothetical protein